MPLPYYTLRERRMGSPAAGVTETLRGLPDNFPMRLWQAQQARYDRYWYLFSGEIWNEVDPKQVDKQGNPVLRFPLQINYAKAICIMHASVLWGEVREQVAMPAAYRVTPRREPNRRAVSEAAKRRAYELEYFLNDVWAENDARSVLQEAGLIQQVLGGIAFRVNWAPDDDALSHQIRIEMVIPDFFLPVWNSARPSELLEAFVIYRIPAREAELRYGYLTRAQSALYVEHWTRQTINITLDGTPVRIRFGDTEIVYRDAPNPFGVVPFVYIPRERAGDYYGISLIEDMEGIMRELNARMANIGDMLLHHTNREVFIRNVSSVPRTQQIGLPRPAINLGLSAPGTSHPPEIIALDPANAPQGLFDFPKQLLQQLMRDASIPMVAFGEDEGSQRSALTLAYRMFPLVNRIRGVRRHWTTGFRQLARIIWRIALAKGLGGVSERHWTESEITTEWAPILVRDDAGMLQTAVQGVQNHFMSPRSAMKYLALTDDPDQEYYDIMEHQRQLRAMDAAARPEGLDSAPDAPDVDPTASVTQEMNSDE